VSPATAAAIATWRPIIRAWARSYGCRDDEDVAQEVLLAFAREPEVRDPKAWLRTVTLRIARDHQARRRELLVEELPVLAAEEDGPEETLVSSQRRRSVWQAIRSLVAPRRRVLVQVAIEGRPLADVAREEGIPESTARSRLREAERDVGADLARRREEERRRSGGFTSWLAAIGLLDLRSFFRARHALAGAIVAGGVLAILWPVESPRPAPPAPAVIAPVALVEDPLPVEEVEETAPPAPTAEPARPAQEVRPPAERARHDAGRRFRAERFGRP